MEKDGTQESCPGTVHIYPVNMQGNIDVIPAPRVLCTVQNQSCRKYADLRMTLWLMTILPW